MSRKAWITLIQSSGCASNDPGTCIDLTQSSWLPQPMYISTGEQLKTLPGQILSTMNYPDHLLFQTSSIIDPLLKNKKVWHQTLWIRKKAQVEIIFKNSRPINFQAEVNLVRRNPSAITLSDSPLCPEGSSQKCHGGELFSPKTQPGKKNSLS